MRTGRKGKRLYNYLSEYGFTSVDELDAAVDAYFATVAQLKGAKRDLYETSEGPRRLWLLGTVQKLLDPRRHQDA